MQKHLADYVFLASQIDFSALPPQDKKREILELLARMRQQYGDIAEMDREVLNAYKSIQELVEKTNRTTTQ